MKRVFFLLFMLCVVCAATNDKGIVGYRTPQNRWVLGDSIDDVNLDDFKELAVDSVDFTVYLDLKRTIQFDGEDTDVTVALFFDKDVLSIICIEVPTGEKSFHTLRRYYSKRLEDCDLIVSNYYQRTWMDDDYDCLTLLKYADINDEPSTLVVYFRGSETESKKEDEEVPQWLKDMMQNI